MVSTGLRASVDVPLVGAVVLPLPHDARSASSPLSSRSVTGASGEYGCRKQLRTNHLTLKK